MYVAISPNKACERSLTCRWVETYDTRVKWTSRIRSLCFNSRITTDSRIDMPFLTADRPHQTRSRSHHHWSSSLLLSPFNMVTCQLCLRLVLRKWRASRGVCSNQIGSATLRPVPTTNAHVPHIRVHCIGCRVTASIQTILNSSDSQGVELALTSVC